MGGFIIGIGLAIVILIIIKMASHFKNKRKSQVESSNSIISLNQNTTDDDKVEKGD